MRNVIMTRMPKDGEVIPPDFTTVFNRPQLNKTDHPHHIFVFLDGTWNEDRTRDGQAIPTNVLRMFQELNHKKGKSQNIIAHYYRGVGNRQDNSRPDRLWFGFNGKDEERIRNAAFADIFCAYRNVNDYIYILGFSRGAASARLLASDICIKGLPPKLKVHTTHFPNLLTGQIEARVDHVERLEEDLTYNCNPKPDVTFLGCWETVDAFVLPSRFPRQGMVDKTVRAFKSLFPRLLGKERFTEEENVIPSKVKKAVHCVAIDETRNVFLPTLMPPADNVEEVWFPGVHSDVGGGYEDNGLAMAPYQFMKKRLISESGLKKSELFKTTKHQSFASQLCFHYHGLNTGVQHAKSLFGFGTGIRRIRVLHAKEESVKPKIHHSLYGIMTSGSVYAADNKNKRKWTITYEPYNVKQLEQKYEIVWK